MRITTLLLAMVGLGALLLSGCSAGGQKGMDGKKLVKSIDYYVMEGSERVLSRTEYYNKQGQLEKELSYYEGELSSTITYAYDEKGNEVEKIAYHSDNTIDDRERKIYQYDGDRMLKVVTQESKGMNDFNVKKEESFKYDSEGRLAQKSVVAVYGRWNYEYAYHENGNTKMETTFAYDDTEKIVKRFDKEGRRTKEDIFRRETKTDEFQLKRTNTWQYNADGTVTAEGIVDGKVVASKIQKIDAAPADPLKEVNYY